MATQFDKLKDRQNFKNILTDGAEICGKYNLPKLNASEYIPKEVVPFNKALTEKEPNNKCVHFFIDDYQFERIWNFPNRYMGLLKRFQGVITPDFSMYSNMPKAQVIWNCYRNRRLAYWMQKNEINIVPVVEWSEYSDLEWCLDGLPMASVLAIGMYGCRSSAKRRYGFIKGVEKICIELNPRALLMYGKEIKSINSLCNNVIWIENYCNLIKKRI